MSPEPWPMVDWKVNTQVVPVPRVKATALKSNITLNKTSHKHENDLL